MQGNTSKISMYCPKGSILFYWIFLFVCLNYILRVALLPADISTTYMCANLSDVMQKLLRGMLGKPDLHFQYFVL